MNRFWSAFLSMLMSIFFLLPACALAEDFNSYTGTYIIPSDVTVIDENTINLEGKYRREDIKTVIVPNNVEKIKGKAFDGCINLQKVDIKNYRNNIEISDDAFLIPNGGMVDFVYKNDEPSKNPPIPETPKRNNPVRNNENVAQEKQEEVVNPWEPDKKDMEDEDEKKEKPKKTHNKSDNSSDDLTYPGSDFFIEEDYDEEEAKVPFTPEGTKKGKVVSALAMTVVSLSSVLLCVLKFKS